MIAENHPSLGMTPGQSGSYYPRFMPIRIPAPTPAPSPAPPAVNQITPTSIVTQHAAPQVLIHLTAPTYTEAPAETSVPASAAATSALAPAAAPADTTENVFDSFLNWLSEQTVFPGYPNGLVFAGGLIAASWLFGGGKRGRR